MPTRRRLLLLGVAGGAVAGSLGTPLPAAFARTPAARTAHLDAQLRQLVEGRSTPGVVALILEDGRPVYGRAVGVREAGGQAQIGADGLLR